LRPSQKNHGLCAALAIGIVRREPAAMPWPTGSPCWNWRSCAWQVAHDTAGHAELHALHECVERIGS
jgi:hypothetical protein